MVRLILEEAGKKRAFNLNDGTITIGSGDACSLTLESTDVADQHAELVIEDGAVTIKPRAGVMPPTVQGRPIATAKRIPPGTPIKIGSARLTIEDPNAAANAGRAPGKTRRGKRVVGTPQTDSHGEGRVQRTRPVATIERGLPSWLIVLFIVIGLGGGGFALLKYIGDEASEATDSVADTLLFAESNWRAGNRKAAQRKFDMIDPGQITPDLKARYEAIKKNLETADAKDEQNLSNKAGTAFLNSQLKNFEKNRLKGNPAKKKIRVFLLRCREFREKFPNHPDIEWVERQESRFRGRIDITRPATFEEIAYEIDTLTWAWPQRYGVAFEKLQPYLDGEDAEAARELEVSLTNDRQEKFIDRMQQAKFEWTNEEKGNKGRAAEILRAIIVNYGDEAMVEQAASEMIRLPGLKPLMEAWKRDKPMLFDEMMENAALRGYCKREGIV